LICDLTARKQTSFFLFCFVTRDAPAESLTQQTAQSESAHKTKQANKPSKQQATSFSHTLRRPRPPSTAEREQ
jgi:hypothetical protein